MNRALEVFWANLKERDVIHGNDIDIEDVGEAVMAALMIARAEAALLADGVCPAREWIQAHVRPFGSPSCTECGRYF